MKSGFVQQLRAAFDRHELDSSATCKDGQLVQRIQKACHKFGVYPSKSQIFELQYSEMPASLKAALRCKRSKRKGRWGLSFELFCVLVSCLKNRRHGAAAEAAAAAAAASSCGPASGSRGVWRRFSRTSGGGSGYRRGTGEQHPLSMAASRHSAAAAAAAEPRCSVFLGGACNPTTWRTDTAVPFLTGERISFYNPQVDAWHPRLVEIENAAKDSAAVLLFVLDPRTRGIAAIVESAFLAGQGRNLVLVIPSDCTAGRSRVAKCRWEQQSIHRSLLFLIDLVERCQIPVFDSLPAGLQAVRTLVKRKQSVTKLTVSDGVSPVWDSSASVSRTLTLLWELFRCHDTGRVGSISAEAAGLVLETMLCGRRPDLSELPGGAGGSVTFPDLCLLYCSTSGSAGWSARLWSALAWPLAAARRLLASGGAGWGPGGQPQRPLYDVFLGGTCGSSRWRDDSAIPRLQAAGISYYNPQVSHWSVQFLPYESSARERSLVLLFVITCDTWSTAAMLEAAHFIGRGARVVLHVQLFQTIAAGGSGDSSNGHRLSPDAVKDYNRGRVYLLDVANRAKVPVLASADEAIEKVIALVTYLRGVS